MIYRNKLFDLFTSMEAELSKIKQAEKIKSQWKTNLLLVVALLTVYVWMASLGMGTNLIAQDVTVVTPENYESSKLWFIVGRMGFALIFAIFVLFVPSLYFHLLLDVPYRKLIIMQQVVLVVLLIERIIWIPLFTYMGLDWYVSPLSLGIISLYATDIEWLGYLFGAITLFQVWLIWFQVNYLSKISDMKKGVIWLNIILLHVLGWLITVLVTFFDSNLISGWFG